MWFFRKGNPGVADLPFVLIIDDDPAQESFALELSLHGVEAEHVFPGAVTAALLDDADIVVIDEYIDEWPEREHLAASPSLYVRDGIALAAVLRAHLENRGVNSEHVNASRTALILRTGKLEELALGLPRYLWPVVVSGRTDLEWVVEKQEVTAAQIAAMAHATRALPRVWDPARPQPQTEWLGVPDGPWRDLALSQVEDCRPPWSTLALTSAGRVWLAWFLQRILPFPTFLIDDARAAAQLGLRPPALDVLLAGDGEIAQALRTAAYKGELANLKGRRWWRAGISTLAEMFLDDGRPKPMDRAAKLEALHGSKLERLDLGYPVFVIDSNYETREPVDVTAAVRLQPDEWPSYADSPWLALDRIEDEPDLAKLIVIDDRGTVAADDEF